MTTCNNEKTQKLTGQCLCGAIAYEIEGKIGLVVNCHCSRCRRWHGSAFRTRATVASKQFKWLRGEELLSKYSEAHQSTKTFCSVCGSNLISLYENYPQYIGLPLGGLEQDPNSQPTMNIFVGSKAPWYRICDGLPQYDEWPPGGAEALRTAECE